MLLFIIIACEIGFWVLVAAGLATRYALHWKRVSTALLLSTPLIDLLLLAASIADLRSGGEADWRHALAAVYLGYTVVFGHRTIKWADAKVAHWTGQGPPPLKPPSAWLARVWYEMKIWFGIVGAYAIAWAITGLFVLIVGNYDATEPVVRQMAGWVVIVGIAALIPASYLLFPSNRKQRESREPASLPHVGGPR